MGITSSNKNYIDVRDAQCSSLVINIGGDNP